MQTIKTVITKEQIIELLPAKTYLYYVDYRDSLDEHLETFQECIDSGNKDALYEKVDEWYSDDFEALESVENELKSDLAHKYDLEEDEVDELVQEHEDFIRETIRERDDSDVLKDLLRNTSKQVFRYDLGYEISDTSFMPLAERRALLRDIKRIIGIPYKNKQWDNTLDMMIMQASYGGNLCIFFRDNVEDYLAVEEDVKFLEFSGEVHVAIVDSYNGSGDHCEIGTNINKHSFKVPFNKNNLFLDKVTKYSYTYDVCGMSSDWCEGTNVGFVRAKQRGRKRIVKDSSLNVHQQREKVLNAAWAKGKCSAGDMNMTRHRNVTYINNYPCGNKCSDCGTFWID